MSDPMTEDEFRKSLINKYPDHFDHFYALYWFADDACRNYRGFSSTAYHASLSLIFAKAFKSYDSIRRLLEVASCEDAGVILRSLLNLLGVTRWISLDPEKHSKKYLASYWLAMQSDAERFKDRFPALWISDIQKHYDRIKQLFEYTDAKGKTRRAKWWYQPEASTIRDLFVQVGLEKQYDEGYGPLSGIEHSDATAYFGMVAGMDKSRDDRKLEIHSHLHIPSLFEKRLPVLRRYF